MKIVAVIILTFITAISMAQHTPINTQYMYHGLLVNPAITGSKGVLVASLSYRNQWLGNDDSPRTTLLSVHTPLKNEKISVGVQIYDDKAYQNRSTGVGGYLAYRIADEKQSLSFGLKLGAYQRKTNWTEVVVLDDDDPFFEEDTKRISPGMGIGIYYRNNDFYLGLSSPELLGGNSTAFSFAEMNFTFLSGYLIPINDKFSFIPNVLLRKAGFGKFQTDATLLVRMDKKIDVGLIYRSKNILGMSLDYMVKPNIQVGYTFDAGFNDLNPEGSLGNHEVSVSYEFKKIISTVNTKFF